MLTRFSVARCCCAAGCQDSCRTDLFPPSSCATSLAGSIVGTGPQSGCNWWLTTSQFGYSPSGTAGNFTYQGGGVVFNSGLMAVRKEFYFDPRNSMGGLRFQTTSTVPTVPVGIVSSVQCVNVAALPSTGVFFHYGTNSNPGTGGTIKAYPYVKYGSGSSDFVQCSASAVLRVDYTVGDITATGEGTVGGVASCYDDRTVTVEKYVDGSLVDTINTTGRFYGIECVSEVDLRMTWVDGLRPPGTATSSFASSTLTVL
jgi:hypothetical protein